MTDWYAPNQQAVRADESGPAEEGDGGAPDPEPVVPEQTEPQREIFDPRDHTVTQVQDYITANPDDRASVLAAEQEGRNRQTLTEWLASD